MAVVSTEPNNHYHHLAFGPDALNRQQRNGSYLAYGRHTERADDGPQRLDDRELLMIRRADQFCLATVTPNGWPYLQYRSGPAGFVRYLPETGRLRFIDLPGNNQFVTLGNLAADDRLAMFFVDYPRRSRLKVFGRGTVIEDGPQREIEIAVDANGRISRVRVLRGGDERRNARIAQLLTGFQLSQRPPAGMPSLRVALSGS